MGQTLETSGTSNSYSSFNSSSEKGLIESQLVYLRGNSSAGGLDMREEAKSSKEASALISSRGGWDCRTEIGWLIFSTARVHFNPLFTEENACGL